MAKVLLVVLVFAAVYWIARAYYRSLAARPGDAPAARAEDMVRCRHCGLHLPRAESIGAGGEFFCCEEHRRQHAR